MVRRRFSTRRNTFFQCLVCVLQFCSLLLEGGKLLVAGLIALPELLVGECPGKREVEQLVLAAGDRFELPARLREGRGVVLLCGKGAQIVDVLLHGSRALVRHLLEHARKMRSSSWL